MSDINSINNVHPAWPVKPAQPSGKDRESGGRNTDRRDSEDAAKGTSEDAAEGASDRPAPDAPADDRQDETTIDEYV